jgi:hypothetical protein
MRQKIERNTESTGSQCISSALPQKAGRGRPSRKLCVTITGPLKVSPVVIKLLAEEIQKCNEQPLT